ncbi:MAG: hypothetical protein FWD03_02485 [Defluviitaleaceae bacterium]|nr:hypothetical protein [Defluviitaleaceae bacterium]
MTVQQKLDLFAKNTFESVNQKRRDTALEIQKSIKFAAQKTEKAAQRNMDDQLKAEGYRLNLEAHKKIHAAATSARLALSALRAQLADDLISDLENDLREFTSTPAYKDFLLEGITSIADDVLKGFPIVQLMTRDMSYIESTELATETTNEDFIGGFRLISANRHAMADYTLLTRLGDLHEDRSNIWN